jgi:drug/metabolite transporter (DMT)-like permease
MNTSSAAIRKGILLALLAAFISGFSIFLNKIALDVINPPLVFTTVKNVSVGLLILGWILTSGKWKIIKNLNHRETGLLALIGIIGGALPFYLFFTGLSQIPAITGAIIQKSLVLWVALLAIPILKEKLSVLQILGVLTLFWANIYIGGFPGFKLSPGEFMVLAATILWAGENILAKKVLPTVDPDIVTAARMGFGSLLLLTASLTIYPKALLHLAALTATGWGWLAISVILLLAYVTSWYRALRLAPATLVTSVLVSATVVTNILSAIFITRTWTPIMVLQILLIAVGLGLLIRLFQFRPLNFSLRLR